MKYIAQKHELGLAIVTWELDADYGAYAPHGEKDGVYYHLYVDIYDAKGKLVYEDGIGGLDIQYREGTKQFEIEMIEIYEYHFRAEGVSI